MDSRCRFCCEVMKATVLLLLSGDEVFIAVGVVAAELEVYGEENADGLLRRERELRMKSASRKVPFIPADSLRTGGQLAAERAVGAPRIVIAFSLTLD